MLEEAYGSLERTTSRAFTKIDRRTGVSELNRELMERVKGYSETVLQVPGGIVLASEFLLFITGLYLVQNHAAMLLGPLLFLWNVPFIDYAESLYCWAANFLLLFSAFIMIRGSVYAVYKSHGRGLWFASLGMLAAPFLFLLGIGVYENNAACVQLLEEALHLLGLSQLRINAMAICFVLECMLASVVAFILFLAVYIHYIKRYGPLPAPRYDLQIRERRPVSNFRLGACTIYGSALLAYAALGTLSLASLALHGIGGAYNTGTFKELWMVYPLMTLGERFGDIGVFIGLIVPFAFLASMPFMDRNFFTSWRRRKRIVALGMMIMVAYAALGFMAVLPSQVEGLSASVVMHPAPAFTYPELPWIAASIVASGLAGVYLIKRSKCK
jgi:quinol-cytochrome oxidoreductase complex cytochrome b subunit